MAYVDREAIKLIGMVELQKTLDILGTPAAEMKAAGYESGEIIAREARERVPQRTGKLKRTIKTGKQLRKVVVQAGTPKSVPYANPIHWGWFYDKENFVKKNIMPNPFLAKALGVKRAEVYDNYIDAMNKLMNRYNMK